MRTKARKQNRRTKTRKGGLFNSLTNFANNPNRTFNNQLNTIRRIPTKIRYLPNRINNYINKPNDFASNSKSNYELELEAEKADLRNAPLMLDDNVTYQANRTGGKRNKSIRRKR